ncbi:uncharacterized protein LOC112573120 isoform X3 [Pomacea canaliculata]|uniref:uncharacterized protein LOC112573120 isoform X3 n=1 Tax=Pomacea canaliculata TaxID=400727 RepID=UPI000D734E9B|nr:uncharacterized protein LOC112573120 isoform X3 [Pomacea canaliculata]
MKLSIVVVVLVTCSVLVQQSDAWLFWKKGARLSQRGFDGATPDEVAKARTMFKEMDDAVKSGNAAGGNAAGGNAAGGDTTRLKSNVSCCRWKGRRKTSFRESGRSAGGIRRP